MERYLNTVEPMGYSLLRRVDSITGGITSDESNPKIATSNSPGKDSVVAVPDRIALNPQRHPSIEMAYRRPSWFCEPAYQRRASNDGLADIHSYFALQNYSSSSSGSSSSDLSEHSHQPQSSSHSHHTSSSGGGFWGSSNSSKSDHSSGSSSDGGVPGAALPTVLALADPAAMVVAAGRSAEDWYQKWCNLIRKTHENILESRPLELGLRQLQLSMGDIMIRCQFN